ncbi:MAG: DUF262 domain-containing protein [Chloroflexi bacterium]|nr:DUF262 domain-containing protein [Chloroflexota bacterium]
MGFRDPITIAKAVGNIQSNRYVLPAIQREFVWKARQIEQLFDSLMQGYPIGSFLFWEVQAENLNEYQFYRFMEKYHQRDYRRNQKINLIGPHSATAVLDGQQRLTALTIGLKGTYASKLPYHRWDSEWAFPPRRLHLNLLTPSSDIEFKYEIRMLRDEDAKKRSEGKFWFPIGTILQFEDLAEIVNYCLDHDLMQKNNKFPHQTLMRLWQVITQNPTITYFLEEEQDLDRVLNIFIRVNSGGTQLSYSDMLLSIATAQWEEYDAREEIYGLVDKLNEIGEGFSFNKDFVLKSCLVLTDVPNVAFRVNNFNKQNMQRIEQAWPKISGALRQTVELLASWGYNRDTLVSNYAIIPLTYYLFKNGIIENFEAKGKYQEDRKKMLTWLRIALLKRVFSGQPDNVLHQIRSVVSRNYDGFPKEEIIATLAGTSKTMYFDQAQLEGLLGYQYKQNYTFSVLALLYPWLKYDQHFHKDHIFPRSAFTKQNLANKGIPSEEWDKWLQNKDSIANLQLLQGLRNIEKSDMMPLDWLAKEYNGDTSQISAYRERHLIPNVELSFENFPKFVAEREKLILARLSDVLDISNSSSIAKE